MTQGYKMTAKKFNELKASKANIQYELYEGLPLVIMPSKYMELEIELCDVDEAIRFKEKLKEDSKIRAIEWRREHGLR